MVHTGKQHDILAYKGSIIDYSYINVRNITLSWFM